MAEIILPPEEEQEETPQAPELNIDKPTENSKVITIEFEAKKTAQVSTKDTNQQLYTTDTDAWFEFKETTLENANGTYSVVFRNRHDGSIFQRTGDVVNGVAYYKIPEQEIRHAGKWRGQLVYTLENGNTTAREFGYDVKGHILDGKDVREIVVEDFETLMSQLRSMKDNAEQELADLVNTAEQNETNRQAFFDDLVEDINDLQENYQDLLDTGVLQTNINTKLEALEEEYAPKLTEVTAQLAHNTNKVATKERQINTSLDVEPVFVRTFDGENEPIHPSVVYFEEGWNGKHFWMAYSPWPVRNVPPYRDRWECPAIVCSDNGRDWELPYGAPDPLVDLTSVEISRGDYLSDPSIVMNGDTMEVWYRHTNGQDFSKTNILRVTSVDGVNWTSPETVVNAEETDNGFGNLQTMRSQQVVFEDGKYTAFFSLQGGTGIWRAETNEPSSRKWGNLQPVLFPNDVAGRLWHIGLVKDNGIYHMTGYDSRQNAIHYYTSSDGLEFIYIATILKGDEDKVTPGIRTTYQTVPVKVESEWLLYASATLRTSKSLKRGIAVYSGDNLADLYPVPGGLTNTRKYYNFNPTLANKKGDNSVNQLYYTTYENIKDNVYNGYKMAFGKTRNAPVWYEQFRNRPIVFVFDDTINPNIIPDHVGVIHRNINSNRMWLSTGTESINDWRELGFKGGAVINDQRKNVPPANSIDVKGVYRLVIKTGEPVDINNLVNYEDGQEVYILNTLPSSVTIKNSAGGEGQIRLKQKTDKVLGNLEGITLIAIGANWYEK